MRGLKLLSSTFLLLSAAIALTSAPAQADVQITFDSPDEVYPYSVTRYGDRSSHTTIIRVPVVRDQWNGQIRPIQPFGHSPFGGYSQFGHSPFGYPTHRGDRFNRFDRFDRFDSFNRFDRFDRFDQHSRFNRGGVNLRINIPFGNSPSRW